MNGLLPERPHPLRRVVRSRVANRAFGLTVAALVVGGLVATPGSSQEPTQAEVDSLRNELRLVRAQLDSLLAALAERETPPEPEEQDALARLRAAAEAAAAAADTTGAEPQPQEREFVGRQRSLQALNPEISVNVDAFGRLGKEDVDEQNFFPREFEFSFQSALDPYSRAKIFVSHHNPGGELSPFGEHGHGEEGEEEGGEISIEEGYMQWVNLPGGLGIKVGKFFQQFGNMNRWHAHALPFQNRSLPHLVFLGEENLSQAGASFYWLVPVQGFGTYEATFEVTRSENGLLFGESEEPSFLGHVNAFWQLTPSTHFDLGVSGIFGTHFDPEEGELFDQRMYNVEAAVNWRPPGRSLYRELMLRGGVMVMDPSARAGAEPLESAIGLWATGEFRFAQQWWLGAQYGWTENPEATDETAWLFSPTLTWWQSEWVRLRAQYDFLGRPDETEGQFLLQVTFAMGPHKHENY